MLGVRPGTNGNGNPACELKLQPENTSVGGGDLHDRNTISADHSPPHIRSFPEHPGLGARPSPENLSHQHLNPGMSF
ncbi:hypothetical protein AG1IA_07951 [Rhizoctonia solani AG-1 IA]|uniref:Uncharacterized protein n=1 Tax=Thanatephorus cucumeris (strain AG1-IA) TaxID=983506 RepID=L8WMJ5_THACA|nr:hypothetical protein AG1IA_07951 [Rhizoctonia solani AG-1 IA]